jgi:D-alanyl-D-alanine carboxypeptidase
MTRALGRATGGAAILAVLALAAACSSAPTPSGGSTAAGPATTTATTSTTAQKACVPDPLAVAAKKPSATTTDRLSADMVTKLDAAAQAGFTEAATPGAVVAVRTPQGTWTQAYGLADPTTKAPMTTDMHFRIGSLTKMYTGTMIMQQVEAGKVSLDDPISKYVPGIPNGDKVTLKLLGLNQSGVASYTADKGFTKILFGDPTHVWTIDELIAVGVKNSPIFPPGERFDYSNTNTLLLGKVLEKVTGKPVETLYRDLLFAPLGLTNTSAPGSNPALPEPHPQGYTLQGEPPPTTPVNATGTNPSWAGPAGELIANAADMLTFGRAVGTGQGLISPATQATRLNLVPGPAGYGFQMGCVDGWVGHAGTLPGWNTTLYYDTTSDSTVVVAVNSDVNSGNCPESPTMTDDPRTAVCSGPATRIFVALSTALGHAFTPNPTK